VRSWLVSEHPSQLLLLAWRGRNVAVRYTICVSVRTKSLNSNMRLRNPSNESNTTWHSFTTIRSNCSIARWRLMLPNASPRA
jgi:hypothetical protein